MEQKLFLTSKVWGFLKYYHPTVNEGKMNWDNELKKIVDKLPDASNSEELSGLYLEWINSLGEVDPMRITEAKKTIQYFDENFDLSWISEDVFSKDLTDKLLFIKNNRAKKLHYLSQGSYGQIFIKNEPSFTASQWEDPHVRLITLFRYWNVIDYFYPYKYKMDKDWDDVLRHFIPKFMQVSTEMEYHLLIRALTVSLSDSHGFFTTDLVRDYAGNKFIAAEFGIIDEKAVITGFYNDSLARLDDLRLGDAIVMVNDTPVLEIYQKNEKYINGSNEQVKKLGYSFRWIFNGSTDSVTIAFERDGNVLNKTIRRYDYSAFKSAEESPIKWKMLSGNIGYANMEEMYEKDLSPMMKEFKETKAIIFDFRNYPEFIIDKTLKYFLTAPKESAKTIQCDLSYPGRFTWSVPAIVGKNNSKAYKGRVILLVNEETQSRSEYFVMAMQTIDGSITIGRQTSGADGDVMDYTFFDDKMTWITGRGIFYPDGTETQRVGIKIDIAVPLTIEDISNRRDGILEKAIEIATNL
jgi:C-terminal processing protease CtpA/Prc